jgi:hypothetical protein
LKPTKAKTILKQVHAAISSWHTHAAAAGVSADWIAEIGENLRLDLLP